MQGTYLQIYFKTDWYYVTGFRKEIELIIIDEWDYFLDLVFFVCSYQPEHCSALAYGGAGYGA